MDEEYQATLVAAATIVLSGAYYFLQKKKKKPRQRRLWMVSSHRARERYSGGTMLSDLRREPSGMFETLCRMSASDFEILLAMIGPKISKKDTKLRKCIPAQERLAITLRFLASGDTFRSLGISFKVSHQVISCIVHEVVDALNESLEKEIMIPCSVNDWRSVARGFNKKCHFPHCLGALDEKHIALQAPPNSETEYFNHKKTHSIVLLAVVDVDYCFLFVHISAQGKINDCEILNTTILNQILLTSDNIPPSEPLPGRNVSVPYVLVADDPFALTKYLMKPYPGNHEKGSLECVFNHRLFQARRIVDNAFGVLSSVFRVFRNERLRLEPSKAMAVTYSCVLLHNFLRRSETSRDIYSPPGSFDTEEDGVLVPGSWRQDNLVNTAFTKFRRAASGDSHEARAVRDEFAYYFQTNEAVPWQENYE